MSVNNNIPYASAYEPDSQASVLDTRKAIRKVEEIKALAEKMDGVYSELVKFICVNACIILFIAGWIAVYGIRLKDDKYMLVRECEKAIEEKVSFAVNGGA